MNKKSTIACSVLWIAFYSTGLAQEEKKSDENTTSERKAPSLGIAPGTANTGDLIVTQTKPVETTSTSTEDWQFGFHGFLRAPMRLSVGKGLDGATQVQSPPRVPDQTYTDWQYTGNVPGPWAELRFSYGNSRVTGNVIIGAWNITSGGYRELQSQLGINQAFVTLTFPRLFGPRGGILWNVGVFQNRYGAAGRYDAGKYETYLFGETHVSGETLTAYYDITDDWTLQLEHGIGAKFNVPPQVPLFGGNDPSYLPYPGPIQQGTTLLHHAHAGAMYRDIVRMTGHYMTTWTDDAPKRTTANVDKGLIDGRITVIGGEVKWTGGIYGDGFVGYARTNAKDVNRLSDGIEVIHSAWGWNFRDNYFPAQTRGDNHIDTIAFQYSYSIATLLWHPSKFWGQGPDVTATIFGMYNAVSGEGFKNEPGGAGEEKDKVRNKRFKIGGEVIYLPFGWFAAGGRYDLVQPNLSDNTKSFQVITPKVIFRTAFLSHEQVVIQYSRYIDGKRVRLTWPYAGLSKPAKDVFYIAVSMWW
jgi:hypothetical protein